MSNLEYYQVYNKNMERCDLKIARPNHVPEGYYFGVVDVITYNKKNNSFLMTKRSMEKPSFPGYLEVTVGCMQYGEEPLDSAKRELREETGIINSKLYLVKTSFSTHAIAYTYISICDIEPDSIMLQKGETEAYYWYLEEEFRKIMKSDSIPPVQKGRIEPDLERIISRIKDVKDE